MIDNLSSTMRSPLPVAGTGRVNALRPKHARRVAAILRGNSDLTGRGRFGRKDKAALFRRFAISETEGRLIAARRQQERYARHGAKP